MADSNGSVLYGPILVTGASGFLGGHVCHALASSRVEVRALVRSIDSAPHVAGIQLCSGDLHNRNALRQALTGVRSVIHLAGRAHVLRENMQEPLTEFRRMNVEGTRQLLEEAATAGVERFVFASSVAAMGTISNEILTEQTTALPDSPYGISKLESEQIVRKLCENSGVSFTILRPPMVYGPGMKGNPLRLFRVIARGVPLPLGAVRNRRSLLYVGNLASALKAVLVSASARNQIFLVGDSDAVSSPQLVRKVAHAMGKRARLVSISPALLRASGHVGDIVRKAVPFPLNSDVIERVVGSREVDYSKLRHLTNYRPNHTMDEGLAITAEWFRSVSR